MAVIASIKDNSGQTRDLYVRLNNLDNLSNHGALAEARFRGFASKLAFQGGAAFTWEAVLPFAPDLSSASKPIWEQAYDALRRHDFATEAKALASMSLAASFVKDGEIARVETAIADVQRGADDSGKTDDPRVQSSIADLQAAAEALRAEKARFETDVAAGRAKVEALDALTAAFVDAEPA